MGAHFLSRYLQGFSGPHLKPRREMRPLHFPKRNKARGKWRHEEMIVEKKWPARIDSSCEIRVGVASWSQHGKNDMSVKFAWPDKNGKVTRGGEVPIEAIPQMLEAAIESGYLKAWH